MAGGADDDNPVEFRAKSAILVNSLIRGSEASPCTHAWLF